MKFFDYIFYRTSNYYMKRWKDDTGAMYGIGVVTIMQLVHLIFIQLIFAFSFNSANEFLFERNEGKNFMHSGAIYPAIVIFGLNLLRYFKLNKFEGLEKIWKDEALVLKKKRGWLIIFYIILNISVTTLLSVYRRYYF